ncbi:MAG: cytochrome b N-terminal domain-containing protein [Candidatus Hydrogenedentes bacterium]|nr:cytochrome b N-terminal domain-containing protein [Candidatus Hydrogenedentota bacterium]
MGKSTSLERNVKRAPGVYGWIDERLDLTAITEFACAKEVPEHKHSFWYYWGGISLFLFLTQLVSGVLLLLYFRPGADSYDSVRQITYDIDFGWLIRSAHSWSANLMVLAIFIHMFSVFFMKAYRKPREFGWWSGLVLAGLTLVFGFSGYLLPMDDLAFFATKVGLEIPRTIPVVGPFLVSLIQGGDSVSDVTIQRFFALHVVVLPLIFIGVLAFHLWLVQKHGNALPPDEELKPESERRSIPFFPNFFTKDLAMWLITLNVLAVLASLYPWQLGPQAEPASPAPDGIHPEWYFMSQFQVLKVFGKLMPGALGEAAGIIVFTVAGVMWTLIPLYDKDSARAVQARRATWFGLVVLGAFIALTIWGYADI